MSEYRKLLERDYATPRQRGPITPLPKVGKFERRKREYLGKKQLILFNLSVFLLLLVGLFLIQEFLLPIQFHWYIKLLISANVGSFIMFGADKMLATQNANQTRIPEMFFYLISLMGGSLGIIVGSKIYRHKTLKIQFLIWPLLIFFAQVILLILIITNR